MEDKLEALRLTAGFICSQVAECGWSLAASFVRCVSYLSEVRVPRNP